MTTDTVGFLMQFLSKCLSVSSITSSSNLSAISPSLRARRRELLWSASDRKHEKILQHRVCVLQACLRARLHARVRDPNRHTCASLAEPSGMISRNSSMSSSKSAHPPSERVQFPTAGGECGRGVPCGAVIALEDTWSSYQWVDMVGIN